jgi:hypothetical protein
VEFKKQVLIVTDGGEEVHKLAEQIGVVLNDCQVIIRSASDFAGTDILSADVCFFGCEEPAPPSFAYLEQLLKHINLVGRPCGVFSPESKEAVHYLSRMVHDAELVLLPEFFIAAGSADLGRWVAQVIAQQRG